MTNRTGGTLAALLCLGLFAAAAATRGADVESGPAPLRRENLVAWCIVPFDAAKRTPEQRAAMLADLGITRCAYDWREEHVSTFEREILAYREHGIEFFAFWGVHEEAYGLFAKYDLHPQIWQMLPEPAGDSDAAKLEHAVADLLPLAERTAAMGCSLGIYNHGGWTGEPTNMAALCEQMHALGHKHIGIVYNFHHGHEHIDDWAESYARMAPHLLCLNINGMVAGGEPKILPVGRGESELEMIRVAVERGYDGPVGIIDHRPEVDSREALEENLEGLAAIREQLTKKAADQSDGSGTIGASYDAAAAASLAAAAGMSGDIDRGAEIFAGAKTACLSCHRIGAEGGSVGPELTAIAAKRELPHLAASVLWPEHEVEPEYRVWRVLTADGEVVTGYKHAQGGGRLVLRDAASGKKVEIPEEEIDQAIEGTTPMPAGLAAAMTHGQRADLLAYLATLKRPGDGESALAAALQRLHPHHEPVEFKFARGPLDPTRWPNSVASFNRDRLYDFYTKQAEYFRAMDCAPTLLSEFPGLDEGTLGHWGNQTEQDWSDDRWNKADLGSLMCGVFRAGDLTVPRGMCVRLGDEGELSACFNPDTLQYEALWQGGFVGFSAVRHGFMDGLKPVGTLLPPPEEMNHPGQVQYKGFYRSGGRVLFAYRVGGVDYLDAPWVEGGRFVRDARPADVHPLRGLLNGGGKPRWPERIETAIEPGSGRPFAIDSIGLPFDNPWKSPLFCGGHDFLSNGDAMLCTMQGDVWRVSGLDAAAGQSSKATWRRFASGLHQALGLVVGPDDQVFVQGRDQLTRLHDVDRDGEADYYECFSNGFETSPAAHDFICGLERDEQGRFYTASGNQGLLRISSDGKRVEVIATGLRNPDGLGLLPDGSITVPVSEGEWTPASGIFQVPATSRAVPHFGYRGPVDKQVPDYPLVYLPRGVDNSAGGQTYIDSKAWGPLRGSLAHFSFGAGSWMVVLRDRVGDTWQGAAVLMAGEFRSGVHRGRFRSQDGQLYVSGMNGWGTYALDDGCFARVRYTGETLQMPIGFHVHSNGIRVDFASPVDAAVASQPGSHFAQAWNYRYGGAYGSPEFSPSHRGVKGHDLWCVRSANVLPDGKSIFLEIPDLQPVSQLHLRMHVDGKAKYESAGPTGEGHDLLITVNALDAAFTGYPEYEPALKTIAAHPLAVDALAEAAKRPNPFTEKDRDARTLTVTTGKNLTYQTRELRAKPGERLRVTLSNPDVVPHNWVLVQEGALEPVGELANRMIADPEAYSRQYIPESDLVIAYTDIVEPAEGMSIYFRAPDRPGRYPYLCTFPGHWMVMNGVMIVE